jgi:hypothetical protein
VPLCLLFKFGMGVLTVGLVVAGAMAGIEFTHD